MVQSLIRSLSFFLYKTETGKLITLEAMSGLSKVLVHLDKKNVHLLAVYIFMKIKPFLESVSLVFIYVLYHVINQILI